MPKNRKILYNPKVSFPTLKENCCTPVQTLSFCVCVCHLVFYFTSEIPDRIQTKKGVHYHMFGRGEAKMAVCTPRLTPWENFTWKVARRMEVARGDVSKEGRGDQTNYLWRPILLLFLQLFLFFFFSRKNNGHVETLQLSSCTHTKREEIKPRHQKGTISTFNLNSFCRFLIFGIQSIAPGVFKNFGGHFFSLLSRFLTSRQRSLEARRW